MEILLRYAVERGRRFAEQRPARAVQVEGVEGSACEGEAEGGDSEMGA